MSQGGGGKLRFQIMSSRNPLQLSPRFPLVLMLIDSNMTSSQNGTFELRRREARGDTGFLSRVAEDEVVHAVDAQVGGLVFGTV